MKKINGFTFDQWLVEAGFELNSPTMWPEEYDELRDEWSGGISPYSYVTAKPRPSEDPDTDEEITWYWSNAAERLDMSFDVSLVGKVGLQKDIQRKFKLLPSGWWVQVFE